MKILFVSFAVIATVLGYVYFDVLYGVFTIMVTKKISLESFSSIDRLGQALNHIEYFTSLSFFQMLFGVGFGTIRSPDLATTLLTNVGVFGVIIATLFVFYPVFRIRHSSLYVDGLKIGIIVEYFVELISVSEFAYLPFWVIAGLLYREIGKSRYNDVRFVVSLRP